MYDVRVTTPRYRDARGRFASKPTNITRSIADPTLITLFGGTLPDVGTTVSESTTLGSSAFFRAFMLISGTLASLKLGSYREDANGNPETVKSVFDDPDGPYGQTPYEWKQTAFLHLLLHGNIFALKIRNEAGSLVRLPLVHPLSVSVDPPTLAEYQSGNVPPGEKWFTVQLNDGSSAKLTSDDVWHVPGPSLDGLKGMGVLTLARQSIGTTLQADRASLRMFSNGALISGLATPSDEYDITDDLPELRRQINREMVGSDNAGTIAIVNRRLNFTPWTMTAADAQFLQSRQFQIEEVARWTGVPPHLLMQTEKQTSWGTGVDEQNRGLGKFVLGPYAKGFEERGSRLLQNPRWIEFDFASLERPSADKEIELLLKQTGRPILTVNEARKLRNLPPIPGGDVLPDSAASPPAQMPTPPANPETNPGGPGA